MQRILCVIFILLLSKTFAQQREPEPAFVISERDLIPEGIAYDPVEKAFYVSSIYKRKIVKLSAKGEIRDFVSTRQDEIQEVLGMKVDNKGLLWACNNAYEEDSLRISNVHVYNTKSKSLVKRYQLMDGKRHLFNDLCLLNSGDVFITDTEIGMIWVINKQKNVLEEFTRAGSISYPNGIDVTADQKQLIVSTANGIILVNIETKEIKPLQNKRYQLTGYDGLYLYHSSLIGVQNIYFPESIHKMDFNPAGNSIENVEFLLADHPQFDLPTTGVVAENYFYFIANSQLMQIIGNKGKLRYPEKLTNTIILKIKLD